MYFFLYFVAIAYEIIDLIDSKPFQKFSYYSF